MDGTPIGVGSVVVGALYIRDRTNSNKILGGAAGGDLQQQLHRSGDGHSTPDDLGLTTNFTTTPLSNGAPAPSLMGIFSTLANGITLVDGAGGRGAGERAGDAP